MPPVSIQLGIILFSNGPDHWKTEQNYGRLVFGPLENRTSKRLVFQCVWYSIIRYSSPHCNLFLVVSGNEEEVQSEEVQSEEVRHSQSPEDETENLARTLVLDYLGEEGFCDIREDLIDLTSPNKIRRKSFNKQDRRAEKKERQIHRDERNEQRIHRGVKKKRKKFKSDKKKKASIENLEKVIQDLVLDYLDEQGFEEIKQDLETVLSKPKCSTNLFEKEKCSTESAEKEKHFPKPSKAKSSERDSNPTEQNDENRLLCNENRQLCNDLVFRYLASQPVFSEIAKDFKSICATALNATCEAKNHQKFKYRDTDTVEISSDTSQETEATLHKDRNKKKKKRKKEQSCNIEVPPKMSKKSSQFDLQENPQFLVEAVSRNAEPVRLNVEKVSQNVKNDCQNVKKVCQSVENFSHSVRNDFSCAEKVRKTVEIVRKPVEKVRKTVEKVRKPVDDQNSEQRCFNSQQESRHQVKIERNFNFYLSKKFSAKGLLINYAMQLAEGGVKH